MLFIGVMVLKVTVLEKCYSRLLRLNAPLEKRVLAIMIIFIVGLMSMPTAADMMPCRLKAITHTYLLCLIKQQF